MKTNKNETKSEPGEFKNYAPIYTPRGIARFPHLTTPNRRFVAEGEFSVDLLLPDGSPEDEAMQAKIFAHWEAYTDTLSPAESRKLKGAVLNLSRVPAFEKDKTTRSTDEEGRELVAYRFKMSAIQKRDGVPVPQRPKIVDSKANVVPSTVNIGGGSVLIVSGKMKAYGPSNAKDGVIQGVKLWLTGAQVLKLVHGSSGPTFEPQDDDDGYTADEAPTTVEQGGAEAY